MRQKSKGKEFTKHANILIKYIKNSEISHLHVTYILMKLKKINDFYFSRISHDRAL